MTVFSLKFYEGGGRARGVLMVFRKTQKRQKSPIPQRSPFDQKRVFDLFLTPGAQKQAKTTFSAFLASSATLWHESMLSDLC